MPIIDGVEYPYTPKGREAARAAAVKVAKKKSEAKRTPLKRRSTEERHKRLVAKDKADRGLSGRAQVVDELQGTKDPGSVELKARQYQNLMEERAQALEQMKPAHMRSKKNVKI